MSLGIIQSNEFGQVEKTIFSDDKSLTATEGLIISHNLCQASLSLYGGHVLTWQPKNQKPVFWMSNTSLYGNDKGIRGGIPICLPWFGAFENDLFQHNEGEDLSTIDKALIANHGFARTSLWVVETIEITHSFVKVVLSQKGENRTPVWNIAYELKQELVFGESFFQSLTIANKSSKPIEYTGALHSYFAVGNPSATNIDKLPENVYFDKLEGKYDTFMPLTDCAGPIDRVYQSADEMNIVDHEWQRIIEVKSFDCSQWVLWNPGKEIASGMSDIHTGGENEYVCLEAANTEPVKIMGESTVSFSQRISIRNL